jgi:hypothetical protein
MHERGFDAIPNRPDFINNFKEAERTLTAAIKARGDEGGSWWPSLWGSA